MLFTLTALFTLVRWFSIGSLMLLFGSAALLAGLRLTLPPGWRIAGGAVALIGACVWLVLAAARMADTLPDLPILRLVVTATLFGQVFVARAALLLLLCAGLVLRWRESILALLAGISLVLISITSHAAIASPANFTAIGITSDGLHLLTGGFWIGGLAALANLFVQQRAEFARAVRLFAEWGMIAVTGLVLTGMLSASTILLGGQGHDTGLYLAVLGVKLALVLAMIGLALVNHFRLLPKLDQSGALLFRNIRYELGLALVVVALASLLGMLPPTL